MLGSESLHPPPPPAQRPSAPPLLFIAMAPLFFMALSGQLPRTAKTINKKLAAATPSSKLQARATLAKPQLLTLNSTPEHLTPFQQNFGQIFQLQLLHYYTLITWGIAHARTSSFIFQIVKFSHNFNLSYVIFNKHCKYRRK